MKKILLIEDRSERQRLFMSDTNIDLNKYNDILDNAIDEKYDEIFCKFKDDTFDFDSYSIIISHKSAFDKDNSSMIEKLKSYCKTHKKPLVFFSGGIDENYYNKSEYELILINSKTFYSQNIELFLEAFKSGEEDILMLLYGKRWKLNIALNTLEKLTYDEFIALVDINLLSKIDFEYELTKNDFDEISRDEIEGLKKELYRYVEMGTIYE